MPNKVTEQEVVQFKHQIFDKLASGQTLVEALYHMVPEQSSRILAYVATQMCTDLQAGISLPTAMAKHKDVFDEAYLHSLEAEPHPAVGMQEFLDIIRGSTQPSQPTS